MKTTKTLLITTILATGLIGLSACNERKVPAQPANSETTASSDIQKKSETPAKETPKNTETQPATPQMQKAAYLDYSEDIYNSLIGKQAFALFFHAPWCGTCRGMEKDIKENLSTLPAGITILKADFDSSTELKKKYGITSQSLVVIIDKTGKALKTLAAPTSNEIKDQLTPLL